MAQPTPEQIQYQLDHINDSRQTLVVSSAIAMIALTTSAVVLRFVVRKVKKIPFWWDDWLCLISLPFSILGAVLSISNKALGHHVLSLTYPQVVKYIKLLYVGEVQYGTALVLVKLAILLFYRRVFPMAHVSAYWRIAWWVLLIVSTATIGFTFSAVFQCHPIAYTWDRTIQGGHCVDLVLYIRSSSAINIVLDILILALPIPVFSKLQMGKSKKIGLMCLFLLGGFVCVTTVVRFTYLDRFDATDPTWNEVEALIWSFVEPCTALICACLPVLVPPFCNKVVALTTSLRSSYSRSKQRTEGTAATIGQKRTRARNDRKSFAQLGVTKDSSISTMRSSDVEMASPIVTKTEFEGNTYGRDDLEKGMQYHARSSD